MVAHRIPEVPLSLTTRTSHQLRKHSESYSFCSRWWSVPVSNSPSKAGHASFVALRAFATASTSHVATAESILSCIFRARLPVTYSQCQAIHNPSYGLDFVPAGVLPRLQFYSRVILRTVVLLSVLMPLLLTYSASRLHPQAHRLWLALLRLSLRWWGPAFTKWGQWASARGDLLPVEIRSVLQTLQNAAPSQSKAATLAVLERSLPPGWRLEDVFTEFDWNPIGVGAIAEVHAAVLTPAAAALCGARSGQVVAVKVKKQGVERCLRIDFAIMLQLARIATCIPGLREMRFDDSLSQFCVPLHQQLSFVREARNLNRFASNFKNSACVTFPEPLWPLVSEDVLVETYIPGEIVRHYVEGEGGPFNRAIAQTGLTAYLQMMLVDNWQHADLHPGNIIVLEPPRVHVSEPVSWALTCLPAAAADRVQQLWSAPVRLAVIDAGMTVSLQREHFKALLELYGGIAELDGEKVGPAMIKLRYRESNQVIDFEAFLHDIREVFRDVDRKHFRENTQEVVRDVLEAMRRHRITMDGAASTVLLTTLALEGWASKLDPDIKILESISNLIHRRWGGHAGAVVGL